MSIAPGNTVATVGSAPSDPGATPPAPPVQDIFKQFGFLLIIGFLFYFLLIRPNQKAAKKTKEMLKALKKGDRVLTSGGMYGTVAGIDEQRELVILRIADEVKVEVARSAVTSVVNPDGGSGDADKK